MEQPSLRYPIGTFTEFPNPSKADFLRWIAAIERTPYLLRQILHSFSEQDLDVPYRPDGWTARQVVHHIADNDMNVLFRIKRTLTEDNPVMTSYNQSEWAELADYLEPVEVSLKLIESVYKRIVVLLRSLDMDVFKRTMISPVHGEMNLGVIVQRLLWHDRHHLAQIDLVSRSLEQLSKTAERSNVRIAITMEMSQAAYEIAKKVHAGRLTRNEGKIEINKGTGMSEGSAQVFLTIFLAMMEGEGYKRAFNNKTHRFLLESIERDFGIEQLDKALEATQKHVDYYSTLDKGHLIGLQAIINEIRSKTRND